MGGFGLSLFFLLSAYLIAELLIRERERFGTIHVKAFFIRRVLRIWPLYFLGVALGYLLGAFLPGQRILLHALPYLLLLAGNFYLAKFGWQLGVIFPLWSLSIEEQFYLAVPTVMKWGGKKALASASFLCLVAAYAALFWLGIHRVSPRTGVWVNSLVEFQFFAAGSLLAIWLHRKTWSPSRLLRVGMLLGSLCGYFATAILFHLQNDPPIPTSFLMMGYGIALVCTCATFLAFLNASIKIPNWVLYLGRISFGLYVFHGMVIKSTQYIAGVMTNHQIGSSLNLLLRVVELVFTIAIASVSYRFFELPILRFKEKFAFVKSGAAETQPPVSSEGKQAGIIHDESSFPAALESHRGRL